MIKLINRLLDYTKQLNLTDNKLQMAQPFEKQEIQIYLLPLNYMRQRYAYSVCVLYDDQSFSFFVFFIKQLYTYLQNRYKIRYNVFITLFQLVSCLYTLCKKIIFHGRHVQSLAVSKFHMRQRLRRAIQEVIEEHAQ